MKKLVAVFLLIMITFLIGCNTTDTTTTDITTDVANNITTDNTDTSITGSYTVDDIDVATVAYTGYDEESSTVLNEESTSYYITEPGTYILRGTITETVTIDVGDEDVRLILDNVNIETDSNSAILVLSAHDVEISVPEGTTNYLSDSANYDEESAKYSSVIYSKADLVFNGTGTLNVEANYDDGIQTKDDLILLDVNLSISSVDDGIIGKDSITIQNATISIESIGDSMKSTYTSDDELVEDKGYIHILSGFISLNSGDDGINASSNIVIDGGTIEIVSVSDAIKAETGVFINDGDILINTGDDAIKSQLYLYINGGTINITDCYEGIEGKYIYINAGTINVTSIDDGINGSDPNIDIQDALGPNQEPDPDLSTAIITISGGTLLIDSEDDAIDSNGIVNISGGIIVINGPTSGTQSIVDYDLEWNQTGGIVIGVAGYGHETKTPTENSTQISFMYNTEVTRTAGTQVTLMDENDVAILSFTPTKEYQTVFISSPDLDYNTEYTLCLGGDVDGVLVDGYYTNAKLENYQTLDSFTLSNIINTFNDQTETIGPPPRP